MSHPPTPRPASALSLSALALSLGALSLGALSLGALSLGALSLGCASAASSDARPAADARANTTTPGPKPASIALGAHQEQRDAQHAWCGYLQDLYLRAAPGVARWPRFEQCLDARTMASPSMLRETAHCSSRALASFTGDPFTIAYAAEVSRCGSHALDAVAASAPDLVPYLATICSRISACDAVDHAECRDTLEDALGPHLRRAVGAMNERGRTELRTCFSAVSCTDLGDQLNACIEPLLDSLLWLPG
ncbi:hypothetical protein [Chondromyces apiculatus]|uniref:Uncharacterized protein n=1 Tax=Chondromyces apiculatus DSM 436 TaxID=1192034 RepID=A0A017TAG9_9BACT|nr:hypothetical protein [Chondromyces apiculatus]EYF05912.1 Hypothetical protein CAP_2914 [Chondromyces apiculatus DSM 436]